MRIVRTVGAVAVWLLATVLLVLAAVLCLTILPAPVGALIGFAAFRLYKLGLAWALPRPTDVRKTVRRQGRRRRRTRRARRTLRWR